MEIVIKEPSSRRRCGIEDPEGKASSVPIIHFKFNDGK